MDTDPAPVTHMIPLIPVLAEFITERAGILTITAGTLLNLVRLASNDSPALVPAIIFSALNSMVVGHLATTRAPFLEGNWQDTSYGFRRLQPLVPATAEFEIPDNRLNLLSDIFAVDAGHTKTVDYVRMWAASGIEATTHFVLVLWAQASPTIPSFPPHSFHLHYDCYRQHPVPVLHLANGVISVCHSLS
ncbi:hypothetical protein K438DRAFT_454330 [Mycena galopus ATCC 62051]|nr:hypothetical protein K438DRAFT_454330 [Mycena galopus ATCC 62051]